MAMQLGSEGDEDEVIGTINTTPLVDVMLVLLIIFLITIPVINKTVKVELPKAVNIPTQTKPDTKAPTTAGGGETGGRGTDVVTVNTGGIEFPYPSYLENIVRQIAIRFKRSSGGALRAEVFFIINRDGSVAASSIPAAIGLAFSSIRSAAR